MTTREEVIRHDPIVRGLQLISLMTEQGCVRNVAHDMIFSDLYPSWMDYLRNDSYWHMRRDWCQTDAAREFWDAIFDVLGLPDPEESWLIIWMSW